jgi:hypothetical protein
MEYQDVEVLRSRLDRLERRMRFLVAGAVLSVGTFVLLGVAVRQAASQPEILRARRIEVVDAVGRTRIILAVFPEGPADPGGPRLVLGDAEGRARIILAVFPEGPVGGPRLFLSDVERRVRISLGVPSDGPSFSLSDAEGRTRIGLDVLRERSFAGVIVGGPSITLNDAERWPRISLRVHPDGSPHINLQVPSDGLSGLLRIFDDVGRVLFRAP